MKHLCLRPPPDPVHPPPTHSQAQPISPPTPPSPPTPLLSLHHQRGPEESRAYHLVCTCHISSHTLLLHLPSYSFIFPFLLTFTLIFSFLRDFSLLFSSIFMHYHHSYSTDCFRIRLHIISSLHVSYLILSPSSPPERVEYYSNASDTHCVTNPPPYPS